ncbi:MAG TPA: hypothetical protein VF808_20205 [Ktedonobacterales bacterium]
MSVAFYQTVAQLCFTLLGLWWLVLQTKYREWIGDNDRRRMATSVSLYFLLPGVMSLIALLGGGFPLLWRTAFLIASVLGAIETFYAWRRGGRRARRLVRVGQWVGFALYIVIALIALIPGIALFGQFLDPAVTAELCLALIVTLGALLAWGYFLDQPVATIER